MKFKKFLDKYAKIFHIFMLIEFYSYKNEIFKKTHVTYTTVLFHTKMLKDMGLISISKSDKKRQILNYTKEGLNLLNHLKQIEYSFNKMEENKNEKRIS